MSLISKSARVLANHRRGALIPNAPGFVARVAMSPRFFLVDGFIWADAV
jgi:hypothetical protein